MVLALIQALQSLQLKIKHLEQGRVEAADHFKQLSKETLRKQQEVDSNEENTPPSLIQSPPVYVDHSELNAIIYTAHSFNETP